MNLRRPSPRLPKPIAGVRRVTLVLPVALIALAVGASLAGTAPTMPAAQEEGAPGAVSTDSMPAATLPTQAPTGPATVTDEASATKGQAKKKAKDLLDGTAAAGIPPLALTAYQRAGSVINASEVNCHLDWQLIAAIGRVESDHGRFGGNVLDADGIARPGIYGPRLDGTGGTQAIPDTDGGQYDKDTEWDRAVGPMQFIPSTWAIVGVDGDSDGVREPQDIDDAALASAVYLCSGAENLSEETGRQSAVYRYNHSKSYVELVLAIYQQYLAGDYTSTPDVGSSVYAPTQVGGPVVIPAPPGAEVWTPGSGPMGGPPKPPKGPKPPKPGQSGQSGKPGKPGQPGKPGPNSGPGKGKPQSPPTPPLPKATGTVDGPMTYTQAVQACIAAGVPADQTEALVTCANEKLAG